MLDNKVIKYKLTYENKEYIGNLLYCRQGVRLLGHRETHQQVSIVRLPSRELDHLYHNEFSTSSACPHFQQYRFHPHVHDENQVSD